MIVMMNDENNQQEPTVEVRQIPSAEELDLKKVVETEPLNI